MNRFEVRISRELFPAFFQPSPRFTRCIDGIPQDARFERVQWDEEREELRFEFSTAVAMDPGLINPIYQVGYPDEGDPRGEHGLAFADRDAAREKKFSAIVDETITIINAIAFDPPTKAAIVTKLKGLKA